MLAFFVKTTGFPVVFVFLKQQFVGFYVENVAKLFYHFYAWFGTALFPVCIAAFNYVQLHGDFFLSHFCAETSFFQIFAKYFIHSFSLIIARQNVLTLDKMSSKIIVIIYKKHTARTCLRKKENAAHEKIFRKSKH